MNECVWIGGTILPVLHAPAVYMYNTSITRFEDLSFVVYCMPSCELEPSTTCGSSSWETRPRCDGTIVTVGCTAMLKTL